MNPRIPTLFPEQHKPWYGENRRRRTLFLPKHLETESSSEFRDDAETAAAKGIVARWADLESEGKLEQRTESELEGEFLTQVFGDALGFTLFSANEAQWNLQAKFAVEGGTADAAIGFFAKDTQPPPRVLIELKGPTVNVDRDRFNGRTPVQQCWDYLNAVPECPWGVVSNCVSFRLYHRAHSPAAYELFVLQDLRKPDVFRRFFYVFNRLGLLPAVPGQSSRADRLLEKASKAQRTVGDELYEYYHEQRVELIQHLMSGPFIKTLNAAIRISQRLLDRIIFVAFCEDRGLLPEESIKKAYETVPPFAMVTNPRWQNFKNLFRSIDKGNDAARIPPFNGGLFRDDPEVNNLELDDRWTHIFRNIGQYDFRHEVNVDVLGHIFEKSIRDVSTIKLGGLFQKSLPDDGGPKMERSAERKRGGIFYTPPQFTRFIANNTVAAVADQRLEDIRSEFGVANGRLNVLDKNPEVLEYCRRRVDALRDIKVVDPACGSGAFLIQAHDVLEERYLDIVDDLSYQFPKDADRLKEKVPDYILHDNLHGVDLSPEAVEIAQLALWIRTAQEGKTLSDLSRNIVCHNSLISDPAVDGRAMDWHSVFAGVFDRPNSGFDCVIGNPPWERMKLQEREFFDVVAPEIAAAVNAATRRKLIEELEHDNPELHARYAAAQQAAARNLDHVRTCGRYPLTGNGDINTYSVFAELARSIVAPDGRVGILVPSGIATDHSTQDLFGALVDGESLSAIYDFENKAPVFPDVHRSLKFSVLLFTGSAVRNHAADFVFFAHTMDDLRDKQRHITLAPADFRLLNPNTKTCPVFRSRRDAELTKAIYRRVPALVDVTRSRNNDPWGIKFLRMFDQTNDAELFQTADQLRAAGFKRDGPVWRKGKKEFLPLIEAKMVQMYDHRAAGVVVRKENWFRQGQTDETTTVQHQDPSYSANPRWWADANAVRERLSGGLPPALLAFKNVTSPTNRRTMIAAFIPAVGVINSAPLILPNAVADQRRRACLLANLNSFALDYVARQKIGNVNLNFFLIEQFPIFPPDRYDDRCSWDKRLTLHKWVSDRVLRLTCTSNDMIPLAKAADFEPPIYKWRPEERGELMAELDAAYFILYGVERPDVDYILSTFQGTREGIPGALGTPSTAELILQHYDRLLAAGQS